MIEIIASEVLVSTQGIPLPVAALRMLCALLLGAAIGWEREASSRAAGLRTHMLIALAASMFTIVAMELTFLERESGANFEVDPLTVIDAVTSGVAFLAAGSIIITGASVKGVTTGASMWLCGAIGVCCGTGDVALAAMGTGFAWIVLFIVKQVVPSQEADEDAGADQDPGRRKADG